MLWFDGTGLWVCAKRLEGGRYSWPAAAEPGQRVTLSAEELALLLGGIELAQTRSKEWWRQAPSGG